MLLEVGETMGGEEEKVDEERRWEWTRRGLSAQLEVPALMGRARHVDAMHLPRGSHASTTRADLSPPRSQAPISLSAFPTVTSNNFCIRTGF